VRGWIVSRRSLVLLLAAFALLATAQTFEFAARSSAPACLSIANAHYRIAAQGERADYTVRLEPPGAAADVRVQLIASIDAADFVLIGDEPARCRDGAIRSVRIDPAARAPDLTLSFSNHAGADYRLYLRGGAVAPEAAAALFAAAQIAAQRQTSQIHAAALTLR
jgi:hypothetical protein